MNTDIWQYPQTEAVFSPKRAHEHMRWLSLDSLAPFWADYPVFNGRLPQARQAARDALEPYQRGATRDPAEIRFDTALAKHLPDPKMREVAGFMAGLCRFERLEHLGAWRAYFGAHQHETALPGLPPETAARLFQQFRDDVVTVAKDRRQALREAVTANPLSDWDPAIHAFYGLNYYSSDQFDKSVVLVGLHQLTDAILFNTFLAQRVTTLPLDQQNAVLAAVRDNWAELAADDPIVAMKGLQVDGAAIAAQIPPAAALIVTL